MENDLSDLHFNILGGDGVISLKWGWGILYHDILFVRDVRRSRSCRQSFACDVMEGKGVHFHYTDGKLRRIPSTVNSLHATVNIPHG